jgi:hypothetical protein
MVDSAVTGGRLPTAIATRAIPAQLEQELGGLLVAVVGFSVDYASDGPH